MRVVVTGADGFLGRNVVERLVADGAEIVAFQRRISPWLMARGVWIELGDVRDRVAQVVVGQDVVVEWSARSGINYGVEGSVDLSGWTDLAAGVIDVTDGRSAFDELVRADS